MLVGLRFVPEDERVAVRLRELVREVPCTGKQVHDANIAATMLVHGVPALITSNAGHFSRFGSRIEVIDLASV